MVNVGKTFIVVICYQFSSLDITGLNLEPVLWLASLSMCHDNHQTAEMASWSEFIKPRST
jgi:hypothetical protein